MAKQSGALLGRSVIDNLVSSPATQPKVADKPVAIPLEKIHRWEDQPRQYFSEKSVSQLAASFRKHGFKGTLVVRPHPTIKDEYQLIAGERRFRAAGEAELVNVLCFIGEFTDDEALDFALGENLHREDLTKLEETLG
ncbi:MAG: ParB/RepB/Spo0J family partition protein, partial [Leptolyngbya sp. SIO4C1]|nr:ParB/RepB/Spo0J family partition protein [Leptolyngbya sp. SIO4C1]